MAANDLGISAFAKPAHAASRVPARTILARLPQAKPGRVFSVGPDGTVEANSAVLAYAAAPSDIDAPFDAVMAGPHIATIEPDDSDLYRPRPRPDPNAVLGWLDGRALGQFAPGQHDWVRNPLPASVFEPSSRNAWRRASTSRRGANRKRVRPRSRR